MHHSCLADGDTVFIGYLLAGNAVIINHRTPKICIAKRKYIKTTR